MKQPLTLRVVGLDSVDMLLSMHPGCEHDHNDDYLTAADLPAARAGLTAKSQTVEMANQVAALARARVDDLRRDLITVKKLATTASEEVAAGRLSIDDASAQLVRLPIIEASIPLAMAEAARLGRAALDVSQLQMYAADRVRLIEAAQVFHELCGDVEALAPKIARYCELSYADGVLLRPIDTDAVGGIE
ncbi:MAG TPA: hypothetical protein DET46_01690 [Comamonadaceae bacterium]|nr:MAG: hypothetical protein A3F76_14740 [Burkholderiales bacterium RIFCSPLOWO2_12_FULL_65_40]HCE27673.1 hypothetical protein [Comamonadaceae bacterium]